MTRPVEPGNAPLPLPPIIPAPRKAAPRKAAPRPVAKLPAPRPVSTSSAANPRGVAIAPASRPTVNDRAAKTLGTGNNPRGVAIATRPAKGKTNDQVIKDIFNHQDPVHQAAIYAGSMKHGADPYIAASVYKAVQALSHPEQLAIIAHLPVYHPDLGKLAQLPGKIFAKDFAGGNTTGPGMQGFGKAAAIGQHNVDMTKLALKVAANTGKDAINLPAQTFSSAGVLGTDLVNQHFGKALNDVVGPYEEFAKHMGKTSIAHPLDTYLMLAGLGHGISRVPAAGVRALAPDSAAGRALATERPSVQLHGKLTRERPAYSPYPAIMASQKALEAARYVKSPDGRLLHRSANQAAKDTAMETSRQVGFSNRLRVANRDAVVAQHVRSVALPRLGKIAHGAKTSLKYDPADPAIKGAGILTLIADGTIRRPDTFYADLNKRIEAISAKRPALLEDHGSLITHDQNVKALQKVAKMKLSQRDIERLFAAAKHHADTYPALEEQAFNFGHFGSHPKEALDKRLVMHYANAHMGATHDAELGMAVPHPKTGLLVPLSRAQIEAHMAGPEGVGGRKLAFTSDRARRGSPYYVSQERLPLPETKPNTLHMYTHGLTDPSHEALLEQHVRMRGIVDAYKAKNRMVEANAVMKPDGSSWDSFTHAQEAAPHGSNLVPINLAEPFHPQSSLEKAYEGSHPNDLESEALTHSLDFSGRLKDTGPGRWALIDKNVTGRLEAHKAQINAGIATRAIKMTNNQFRKVALGTSVKHIPGIISETAIRQIAAATGLSSWIVGRKLIASAVKGDPELGQAGRTQVTGGTVAGMAKAAQNYQTSEHFHGTNLEPVLKGIENVMKAPGPRQLHNLWGQWLHLTMDGVKHVVEEQAQVAAFGKVALQDFGRTHGPLLKAIRMTMTEQGKMLDDAAKGLYDPAKLRHFRAGIENIMGRWTDLTPHGQNAMMYSPFGLWWVNSVKWLMRSPIDRPVQTGAAAALNVGTEKERQKLGFDLFSPNHLPLFMQGGIGLPGGKVLGQNYYSPFGVANDPFQTWAQLTTPVLQSAILGLMGKNWLGEGLSSPSNKRGFQHANGATIAHALANSVLSTFLPFYQKAQTIAQGGASAYDSSDLLNPQTKTPNPGVVAGIRKAATPYRLSGGKAAGSQPASAASSGGWGSSSAGDSSGWGSSAGASGGW